MSPEKTAVRSRLAPLALPAVASILIALSAGSALAQGSSGGSSGGSTGTAAVVIKGHGQTVTQTVKDNSNVRIVGDANTVTLKGKLNGLHVGGDENGVRVEKVKAISTRGDGNLVKWKSGPDAKTPPKISDTGEHNTIVKDDGGSLTPPKNPAMNTNNAAKTGQ